MRVRLQDSNNYFYVEVDNPYLLCDVEINKRVFYPKLREVINKRDLKCSGCGELLYNNWVSILERPKNILEIWGVYLFCFDKQKICFKEWKEKRRKLKKQ
jgi:hypothetical protein